MLLQKPVQGFTAKHALADALFFPEVEPLWHLVPSPEQLLLCPGLQCGAQRSEEAVLVSSGEGSRFQSGVLSHSPVELCPSQIWDLHMCCRFCVILLANWLTRVISRN